MRFHFSEIIFIVGFVAYVVIRGVFEQRAKASSIVVKRVNTGETALLIVMAFGGMVVPVVYLLTHFLHLPTTDFRNSCPMPALLSSFVRYGFSGGRTRTWGKIGRERLRCVRITSSSPAGFIARSVIRCTRLFGSSVWLKGYCYRTGSQGGPRLLRLPSCISFAWEMKSE